MHSSMVLPFVDEMFVWMMSAFVAYLDSIPQAICELLLRERVRMCFMLARNCGGLKSDKHTKPKVIGRLL